MDKQQFTEQIMALEQTLDCIARTYLHSPHDCADVVQETVLRAWKNRHTLRNEAYFKTWVVRILINQCKNLYRRRQRTVPVAEVPMAQAGADTADFALRDAVMALDLMYRVPFVLHYVEGYATKEIAQILGLPKGTVLSRLKRARDLLQKSCCEEVCQR